jgi:hypothetical protein
MAREEVNTENFTIEATSDEEAQAKIQEIIDTKDLEEGTFRTELDPVRVYTGRLYQTVEKADNTEE